MKRIISLSLTLILLLSFGACGVKDGPYETEVPDKPTEKAWTQAPETPDPSAVTFTNLLETPVKLAVYEAYLGYSPSEYDTTFGGEAAPGGSISFTVDLPGEAPSYGGRLSLSALDNGGNSYYIDRIDLAPGSLITLLERDGRPFYEIETENGSEEYPALTVKNGDPLPKDDRILGFKTLTCSGSEAAETICAGSSLYVDAEYQAVLPDDETAERFRKLSGTMFLTSYFITADPSELCRSLMNELIALGNGARGKYSHKAFIRRADTRAVSVLWRLDLASFDGQRTYWLAINLDPYTGTAIGLYDVLTDEKAFTNAARRRFAEAGFAGSVRFENTGLLSDPGHAVWTLDHDGISAFLWDGSSVFSIFVPFSELEGCIREEYLPETDDFTVAFPYGLASSVTLKDGRTAELCVSSYAFTDLDDGNSSTFTEIGLNGETSRFYGLYDASEQLFVHSGGRDYIYVSCGDAMSKLLAVYELDNFRVYYLGCIPAVPYVEPAPELYPFSIPGTVDHAITDPHSFLYCFWVDALGTAAAFCETAARGDGIPARTGEVFFFESIEFGLLCDIEAKQVNEAGEVLGSITLKKGDTVQYYRTDGESWADVKTADGSIARVCLTFEENWPPVSIDGVPVPEIFEGADFIDY